MQQNSLLYPRLRGGLTRHLLNQFPLLVFVPSRRFADGLVACCQRHDGDERQDEGGQAGDPPAAEDDAQVCCVPCEEHLCGSSDWDGSVRIGVDI